MLVLGIDPGLADTGWGLVSVRGTRLEHLAHGTFHTKAHDALEKRLLGIHQGLAQIVNEFHPDAASIETLYFSKNVTSALPVAHARGAVYLTLAMADVPVFEYGPAVIKQSVVGSGRAEKEQVQAMVRILLGLAEIPKPDHAADAIAAAICHIHTKGGGVRVS